MGLIFLLSFEQARIRLIEGFMVVCLIEKRGSFIGALICLRGCSFSLFIVCVHLKGPIKVRMLVIIAFFSSFCSYQQDKER